jgi:hypothetical protein
MAAGVSQPAEGGGPGAAPTSASSRRSASDAVEGGWLLLSELAALEPAAPSWAFLQGRWRELHGAAGGAEGGVAAQEGALLLWAISHAAVRFPPGDALALASQLLQAGRDRAGGEGAGTCGRAACPAARRGPLVAAAHEGRASWLCGSWQQLAAGCAAGRHPRARMPLSRPPGRVELPPALPRAGRAPGRATQAHRLRRGSGRGGRGRAGQPRAVVGPCGGGGPGAAAGRGAHHARGRAGAAKGARGPRFQNKGSSRARRPRPQTSGRPQAATSPLTPLRPLARSLPRWRAEWRRRCSHWGSWRCWRRRDFPGARTCAARP